MGLGQIIFGFLLVAIILIFNLGSILTLQISPVLSAIWVIGYIGLLIYFLIYRVKRIKELTKELEQLMANNGLVVSEKVTLIDYGSTMFAIRPESGIWFDYANKRLFIRPFEKYTNTKQMKIIEFSDIIDYNLGWIDSNAATTKTTSLLGIPIMKSTNIDHFVNDMELQINARVDGKVELISLRPLYSNRIKSDGLNSKGIKKKKLALSRMGEMLAEIIRKEGLKSCPSCGLEVPKDVSFCHNCGTKFSPDLIIDSTK
jgi:hypothetical protein